MTHSYWEIHPELFHITEGALHLFMTAFTVHGWQSSVYCVVYFSNMWKVSMWMTVEYVRTITNYNQTHAVDRAHSTPLFAKCTMCAKRNFPYVAVKNSSHFSWGTKLVWFSLPYTFNTILMQWRKWWQHSHTYCRPFGVFFSLAWILLLTTS